MWLVALGAGVLSLLTGPLPLTGVNSAQPHDLGLTSSPKALRQPTSWLRSPTSGSDQAQGFHLSRPLAPHKIPAYAACRESSVPGDPCAASAATDTSGRAPTDMSGSTPTCGDHAAGRARRYCS